MNPVFESLYKKDGFREALQNVMASLSTIAIFYQEHQKALGKLQQSTQQLTRQPDLTQKKKDALVEKVDAIESYCNMLSLADNLLAFFVAQGIGTQINEIETFINSLMEQIDNRSSEGIDEDIVALLNQYCQVLLKSEDDAHCQFWFELEKLNSFIAEESI